MDVNINALRLQLDGLQMLRNARTAAAGDADSVEALNGEIEAIQAQLAEAEMPKPE